MTSNHAPGQVTGSLRGHRYTFYAHPELRLPYALTQDPTIPVTTRLVAAEELIDKLLDLVSKQRQQIQTLNAGHKGQVISW